MITYVDITKYPDNADLKDTITCAVAGGDRYVKTTDQQRKEGKNYYIYSNAKDQYVDYYGPVPYPDAKSNYICEKTHVESTAHPKHGLIIKKIDGLGEINTTIGTTDYTVRDGSYFNGARIGNRNIVITFILSESYNDFDNKENPTGVWNIENSRLRLYNYFPAKKKVRLSFKTDVFGGERIIEGRVESVKPDIFSKDETVDVSIICQDPFFKVNRRISLPKSGEFNYKGNADTGCVIRMRILQNDGNPTINGIMFNKAKLQEITNNNYGVGGVIQLSSMTGEKYARYYPNYSSTGYWDIMTAAGVGPYNWTMLENGKNKITLSYSGSDSPDSPAWPDEDEYVIIEPDTEPGEAEQDSNLIVDFYECYGGI